MNAVFNQHGYWALIFLGKGIPKLSKVATTTTTPATIYLSATLRHTN